MKVFYLFPIFFFFTIVQAQSMDLEERDDSFLSENSKNVQRMEIRDPIYMVKPNGCEDFRPASFEGGVVAYKELLTKYMYEFLNTDFYAINGTFTFMLTIDHNGKVLKVKGFPNTENSEVLFDDMSQVVHRIQKNWKPAQCFDKNIDSVMKLKINFSSATTDF